MTDLKQTVSLTSVNSENMSRHQMLEWVNTMVNGHFKKIEELCSGVAYCQMMEMIFPNCINIKRVKMSAKLEHECFHNMKLFQGALTRLKLDKTIPVDRLIKGRFQDNFEFLQWFKKFFDSQAPGLENIKSAANAVQPKPIKPRAMIPKDESSCDLRATIEELNQKTIDVMDKRDRAYEKLRQIEVLLTETINRNEHVTFCNRVCEVLYKTDQDENSADRQEIALDDVDDMNMGMY
ncbi:hypothetical protein ACLKA6_015687 [Drosophila palustris]